MNFYLHLILILLVTINSCSSPQLAQVKISLNGEWLFSADSQKIGIQQKWFVPEFDRSDWEKVQTPAFWEEYPSLANYDGWGWYAKKFFLEKISEPVSLHLAGVDDDAVVWINGIEIGSHTGYSDPFALDLKNALLEGENFIVVQVLDYGGGGGIYKPITLIDTKYLDELLKSEYFGKQAVQSADWVRDAVIYSVYLRSFSKEGNFAGLEKRIPELKDLGATVLWMMPIHPVGITKRKGRLGSPYSIQDYYSVNPEFGKLDDFKKLLRTVHDNNMKLIIDLVANHTSWDSKLIKEHPEWFNKDNRGNIIAPNSDWSDVADLDYSKPELRKYMIKMMKWWVDDVGIDGFRCDVSELVPTDFWETARDELNKIKPVMMLSEGSIPEHHMKAFDITYSWNVYDALEPLLKGKRPVELLDQIFQNEFYQFPTGSLRLRFNTNHDKNAWDAPTIEKFGLEGLKLSIVLINTIPGIPMIYTGEEVANDKRLDLFDKVDVDWNRSNEIGELYKKLFNLRHTNRALTLGSIVRVSNTNKKSVYAFFRIYENEMVLVILNFSNAKADVELTISETAFKSKEKFKMQELFTDDQIEISKTGHRIFLNPFDYKVFVKK
ncbi:MAG: alpha-amylase family glycosyl hydrolase [Bacteroidota bacterium]|nr:alpha-amylase family glycosyl hydrolase [Bacteroidota bacterium]